MKEQYQKLIDRARLKSSALFLDRDGVINKRVIKGYVLKPGDFIFLDGAGRAISQLNRFFNNIFIVTNQQCVGKKLISISELDEIHKYMVSTLNKEGAFISDIFVSVDLESDDNNRRKPKTGMALEAAEKYPSFKLEDSVMVGDSASDMLFARNTGMMAVLVGSAQVGQAASPDLVFDSLKDFSDFLIKNL